MNSSIFFRLSSLALPSVLLVMIMSACGGSDKTQEAVPEEETSPSGIELVEIDNTVFTPEAKISGLTYDNVNYDKDKDTYSFEAHTTFAHVSSQPKVLYKLEYSLDENEVLTSEDGNFVGVKPLKSGAYYILRAQCEGLEPVQTEIPSQILPVIPKITKPTAKEIEAKLNDKVGVPLLSKNDILNPECKYEFQSPEEDTSSVTSIQRLYEKIAFDWSGIEVVSLEYDEYNRVNKIIMKIIY